MLGGHLRAHVPEAGAASQEGVQPKAIGVGCRPVCLQQVGRAGVEPSACSGAAGATVRSCWRGGTVSGPAATPGRALLGQSDQASRWGGHPVSPAPWRVQGARPASPCPASARHVGFPVGCGGVAVKPLNLCGEWCPSGSRPGHQ